MLIAKNHSAMLNNAFTASGAGQGYSKSIATSGGVSLSSIASGWIELPIAVITGNLPINISIWGVENTTNYAIPLYQNPAFFGFEEVRCDFKNCSSITILITSTGAGSTGWAVGTTTIYKDAPGQDQCLVIPGSQNLLLMDSWGIRHHEALGKAMNELLKESGNYATIETRANPSHTAGWASVNFSNIVGAGLFKSIFGGFWINDSGGAKRYPNPVTNGSDSSAGTFIAQTQAQWLADIASINTSCKSIGAKMIWIEPFPVAQSPNAMQSYADWTTALHNYIDTNYSSLYT
jgi:hypothetical protein